MSETNPADHIAKISHALVGCQRHLACNAITYELEQLYGLVIEAEAALRDLGVEVGRRQRVADEWAAEVGDAIETLERLLGRHSDS